MGLILKCQVPTKVATKRKTLIQNCHGFTAGVLKFSSLISSKVAAPNNPTTAGRNPIMMLCTVGVLTYFRNTRAMAIINISEGSTKAKVATALPNTDIQ